LSLPAPGSYFVAIQVVSGPDPGHVEFAEPFHDTFTVSQQFGSAGGTSYPSIFGHPATATAIGVGAVPWWAASPFLDANLVNAEPFNSFGPALSVFHPDGSPKTPQLMQQPLVSGPDGGNTSFFPAPINQNLLDTAKPPNPGRPATPTNPAIPGQPA